MTREQFKARTKAYALRIIRLVEALPRSAVARVLGNQLLRAGTSVGANYRAAARARSRADFVAKMGLVEEECDESLFWIEMLIESGQLPAERVKDLLREGNEILAMTVASTNTARSSQPSSRMQKQIVNPQSAIRN